jgi:HD superfamily phosphodiesterase
MPERWRHVGAVAEAAERTGSALSLDTDVLVAATWLHDIGYSPALTDTGFHPLDGARYLRTSDGTRAWCSWWRIIPMR